MAARFRAEFEERDRHFDVAAEIWEKLAESEGSPELAAREWQASIWCLIRAGRRITALAAITQTNGARMPPHNRALSDQRGTAGAQAPRGSD